MIMRVLIFFWWIMQLDSFTQCPPQHRIFLSHVFDPCSWYLWWIIFLTHYFIVSWHPWWFSKIWLNLQWLLHRCLWWLNLLSCSWLLDGCNPNDTLMWLFFYCFIHSYGCPLTPRHVSSKLESWPMRYPPPCAS